MYARDNVFFFKLYLFLKAYFTLKKIRLISCDLRITEQYTKILYLVINTVPKRKKKKITFQKRKKRVSSGNKRSLFRDPNLNKNFSLLFHNLPKLKKNLIGKILPFSKRNLNFCFYTKPRLNTWLNYFENIKHTQNFESNFSRKKKLWNLTTNYSRLHLQQLLFFKLIRTKTELILLNNLFKNLNKKKVLTPKLLILYKTKLEELIKKAKKIQNIFACFHSTPAANLTNKKKLQYVGTNKIPSGSIIASRYPMNFISVKDVAEKNKEYLMPNFHKLLPKFRSLIKKHLNVKLKNADKDNEFWPNIQSNLYKPSFAYNWYKTKKLAKRINKLEYKLKKKLTSKTKINESNLQIVKKGIKFYKKKKSYNMLLNDNLYKKIILNLTNIFAKYYGINTNALAKNNYITHRILIKLQQFIFDFVLSNLSLKNAINQVKNNCPNLIYNNIKYPISTAFLRILRRKRKKSTAFNFQFFKNSRIKKKGVFKKYPRTFFKFNPKIALVYKLNTEVCNLILDVKNQFKEKIKKQNRTPVWKIRQGFRNAYKNNLNTIIRYQYKLSLQRLLLNFFKSNINIKFVQPLTQYKNLKFFRLVYPLAPFIQTKKIKLISKKNLSRKFPVNVNQITKANKNISLRQRYIFIGNNVQRLNSYYKFDKLNNSITKKNTYLFKKRTNIFKRLREQRLTDFTKNRFKSIRRSLLMQTFTPILSLFIKYLNPQILADHIAKEFEKTKKHKHIIYALSTTLRSLKFSRAIGYRIAIAGRINSSKKSRSYYLAKKTLIRQNFSKKVNFAFSQARARIGSFGIKVWIFY